MIVQAEVKKLRTTFDEFFQNSSPAVKQFFATEQGQHDVVFIFQALDAYFRLSDEADPMAILFVDVRNAFNCMGPERGSRRQPAPHHCDRITWGSLSLPSRFKLDLGLFWNFGVDLRTTPVCGCRHTSPCMGPDGMEPTLTKCKSSG